jgi:hypothetical protein
MTVPAACARRLRSAQICEPRCVVVTITGTRPATWSSTHYITRSRSSLVSTYCSDQLARMQMPSEPASIMKSMQRLWPPRSNSPLSSNTVDAMAAMEALERRDEVALAKVLTRHLEETWTLVRPSL